MPHPTAAPFTAATTGTSVCSSASAAGVSRGCSASELHVRRLLAPAHHDLDVVPEQNAGSAPVMTRQRAVVVRTASSSSA